MFGKPWPLLKEQKTHYFLPSIEILLKTHLVHKQSPHDVLLEGRGCTTEEVVAWVHAGAEQELLPQTSAVAGVGNGAEQEQLMDTEQLPVVEPDSCLLPG